LEEVGGEGVAEGVAGDALGEAGSGGGELDGALEHGFVDVGAAPEAGRKVEVPARGGEEPLPGPLEAGVRGLAGDRGGKGDGAEIALAVGAEDLLGLRELAGEVGGEDRGEDGAAVAAAFGIADGEFTAREVDVLHAQGQCFEETQSGSVEELE